MGRAGGNHLGSAVRSGLALNWAAALTGVRPPAWVVGLSRYRLTWCFLALSSAIFIVVALRISAISANSAESNILTNIRTESTEDAMLIATVVSRAISMDAGESNGLIDPAAAGSMVSEFLTASSIFRLALYDPTGRKIWVSNTSEWGVTAEQEQLFDTAMAGEIASGLLGGQVVRNRPAVHQTLDIVETYIPFTTSTGGRPSLVLGISRDVTDTLAVQMGQIRSGMSKTILLTMAGGFAALLLFILAADIALMRTKERALEQERTVARQRLSIEQMDIENRELERASAERTRFVSMVTHELRTPLTSIVAFVDILIKTGIHKEPAQTSRYLEIIKRNGLNLQGLVSDLLDVGKFQSSNLPIEPSHFSLPALLAEVHESMGVIFETKRQVVEIDAEAGTANIRADRTRIAQVIRNLLSNASKYSPSGSRVDIRASAHENVLAVTVRDHGVGISKEDLKRLFTPFFRADNEATRSVPGTGLGLAIVKAIVEAHGGAISIESELGHGTEVTFRIPTRVQVTDTQAAQTPVRDLIDAGAPVAFPAQPVAPAVSPALLPSARLETPTSA